MKLFEYFMPRTPLKTPQNDFSFKLPVKFGSVNDSVKLFHQGLGLLNQGNLTQAKNIFEQAVKINPKHLDAINFLGIIAAQTKNYQLAVGYFDSAIKLDRNNSYLYCSRGRVYLEINQIELALINFKKAISLQPSFAEAYCHQAIALALQKQLNEALDSIDKAISINPEYSEAFYNRGNMLKELNRLDEALLSYDKAIALQPDFAVAHNNKGNVLKELNRFEEALTSYDKAIELKSDYADAYLNRGIILNHLKQFVDALSSYGKAIETDRNYAEAYLNRGNVLTELNFFNEAFESYNHTISLKPNYAQAYWNKSLLHLLLQDFENGWELYEWRWKKPDFTSPQRNFTQPLWLGLDSLANKTILLHAEQGLGDTIQFCRYAALVKKSGAKVLLEVPKSLMELLKDLDGVDHLLEQGMPLPDFDYHCPLLSLPLAFKTVMNSIPSPRPYLRCNDGKLEIWNQRLGDKLKPRFGLVWSGNTAHKHDRNRSLALADLVNYLPKEFEYVSLQKEVRDSDKQVLASNSIKHFEDDLNDFSDTAALCDLMDIIISVDTSVAHLSGALGKLTWILLAFVPDWRWLLKRNDSPWYESVKLYRQSENREWAPVLEQLARDLTKLHGLK